MTDNCGKLAVYNTVPLSNQPQTDEDVLLAYFSASLTHGCFHLIRHLDKFTRTRRTEGNMNSIPKQPSYNATKLQEKNQGNVALQHPRTAAKQIDCGFQKAFGDSIR